MKFRPQIQLRFRDAKQYEGVKTLAEEANISLNEYILRAVEKEIDGQARGTARGSGIQRTHTVSRRGLVDAPEKPAPAKPFTAKDIDFEIEEALDGSREAERVSGAQGVQGMRSGVSQQRRTDSAATVLGPFDEAPTHSSTVGRSIQPDSRQQEAVKIWEHPKNCVCARCKGKKRKHGN